MGERGLDQAHALERGSSGQPHAESERSPSSTPGRCRGYRPCRTIADKARRILDRVDARGAGAVWTPIDFLDLGPRAAVDRALQRLTRWRARSAHASSV
jgi:hypothetical protein